MDHLIRCLICNQFVPDEEICEQEGACTECCTCEHYSMDWPIDNEED